MQSRGFRGCGWGARNCVFGISQVIDDYLFPPGTDRGEWTSGDGT